MTVTFTVQSGTREKKRRKEKKREGKKERKKEKGKKEQIDGIELMTFFSRAL